MVKKRLVFALLWQKGFFWLSRNFRIQKAGDKEWLERHYNFSKISDAIDELIVLNVSREQIPMQTFVDALSHTVKGCFVPVAAGGGVNTAADAQLLLRGGADKVVVNTALVDQPDLIEQLARTYGAQCIVASIDYKRNGDGSDEVVVSRGTRPTGLSVREVVRRANSAGAGEVLLTSIERDGAGHGYDLDLLRQVAAESAIPIIASGGVGNFEHLAGWLNEPIARAACTANIFNFIGDGLLDARRHLVAGGVSLAAWEFGWRG